MSQHWTFAPAVGFAFNLDEGDRTSLFGDAEINYIFARGAYLGTGVTLWDFTHSRHLHVRPGSGQPVCRCGVTTRAYRQLLLSLEWRQMFDRMSDPDVNYQFWGGLQVPLQVESDYAPCRRNPPARWPVPCRTSKSSVSST